MLKEDIEINNDDSSFENVKKQRSSRRRISLSVSVEGNTIKLTRKVTHAGAYCLHPT